MFNAEPNFELVPRWKSSEPEYVSIFIFIDSWGLWTIPNQLSLGVDELFQAKGPLCVIKGYISGN